MYLGADTGAGKRISRQVSLAGLCAMLQGIDSNTVFGDLHLFVSEGFKLEVLKFIEEESEKTCDEIIILLSEKTASTFKTISIILGIVLFLLNIKTLLNIFIYFERMIKQWKECTISQQAHQCCLKKY